MRSPVNWALLGLIIEQPSYAYDLAQRFERRYGDALQVSSVRHIYTALESLNERTLVEEIPGTREGRQPRPRYRATERGVVEYGNWLVSQVGEDRHRREVFVLSLLALAGESQELSEVMRRCEEAWLQAGIRTPIARDRQVQGTESMRQLIDEENRLTAGAKLAWIEYARQELGKLKRR